MSRSPSLMVALCTLLFAAAFTYGQQIHLPPAVSQSQGMGSPPVVGADNIQKQQARAAGEQRQLEIKRDTQKMAELTQELKDYIEKSETGVVSVDAVKKAEQIEKLAHSVKSKLKQSF